MSDFITVPELARLLRVPESRIYFWTQTRAIPAYRAGKRLVFDRDEVLRWFRETQALQATAPIRRPRILPRRRRRAPWDEKKAERNTQVHS